jgi:hypothetical protein
MSQPSPQPHGQDAIDAPEADQDTPKPISGTNSKAPSPSPPALLLPFDGSFVTMLVDRVTDRVRARLGHHADPTSPYLTVKEAA